MAWTGFSTTSYFQNSGQFDSSAYPVAIQFWYRPTNTGSFANVYESKIGFGNVNGYSGFGYAVTASSVRATNASGGTGYSVTSTSNTLLVNTWNHIVFVFRAGNSRSLWLNNVRYNNTSSGASAITTGLLTIGSAAGTSAGSTGSSPALGAIAEIATWDADLTDRDVASLYAGAVPSRVRPDLLRSYIPFLGSNPEPNLRSNTLVLTRYGTGTTAAAHVATQRE